MRASPLPLAVYYEIVRKPYFVIVHSRVRVGHERFDQYVSKPDGLIEFMLSVVEHITSGQEQTLDRMCVLDDQDKQGSAHRKRRYIAKTYDELIDPVEYKGYGFSTNADRKQAYTVIELACRATEIPYITVRKFEAFKRDA